MNSSLRTVAASGMTPFCRLAAASLNETSLTLSEKVENALSRVWTSGCGTGGGMAGLGGAASGLRIADCGLRIAETTAASPKESIRLLRIADCGLRIKGVGIMTMAIGGGVLVGMRPPSTGAGEAATLPATARRRRSRNPLVAAGAAGATTEAGGEATA